MPAEIFYYVHHHGGGHRGRAAAICRELPLPVTLFSSTPPPTDLDRWVPAGSPARREWVELPLDTEGEIAYREPTAGGRLHWAPLHQHGLQQRHARLLAAVAERRPALLVSDVSVEIAVLARLSGVPAVTVLLPGERLDAPHRLAFDLSTGLLAPWPRPAVVPEWLRPWLSRTVFTGGIAVQPPSGPAATATARRSGPPEVVVAFGAGQEPGDRIAAAAAATPGWTWRRRADGAGPWSQRLADADVVVAHAGLGTVADLAVVGARSVVLPSPRPFGEQHATAALVRALGVGPVLDGWPDPGAWPALLADATAADPAGWRGWGVQTGAATAAQRLLEWAG